jgi:hypothetical protein
MDLQNVLKGLGAVLVGLEMVVKNIAEDFSLHRKTPIGYCG